MVIVISSNLVNNFTKFATRNGIELPWKRIEPVLLFKPKNTYCLPYEIINEPDIAEALQGISIPASYIKDESEVEFCIYDNDGNIIN